MKRQRQERDLLVDGKNKENVVVGRTGVNCRSRIPVPTKPKSGTVLTTVRSKENHSERLSPELKSQAKQEGRKPTEVREFVLTPLAKRANVQRYTEDHEFEEDPRSLQAILDSKPIRGEFYHHNTNTPSTKIETRQSRGPHRPPWNDSPTCLVGRYSVYAKSMAEARALNATATTPGTTVRLPNRSVDIVDELCNKLVASTLKKTIGRSRVAPVKSAFQDVKLNLDGQFSECLEGQPRLKCSLPPSLPLRAPVVCFDVTGGGREDSVLGEDEEVMRLLQGRPKLYGASRSSCPNPVASELQMCYFVPVCI
ncbi:hypothetical protein EMCRGX_G013863 [Ephydatia muelleri]